MDKASTKNIAAPPKGLSKLISDDMRLLIRKQHQVEKWGRDGHKHARVVMDFIKKLGATSILDYGCGRGTLRAALTTGGKKIKGMGWQGKVHEYDPAVTDSAIKRLVAREADLVVCTDVLEHVEPDKIMNVLHHMAKHTRKGLFLIISTRESNRKLMDGRNAHLIIESSDWWLPRLHAVWPPDRFTYETHIHPKVLTVWIQRNG